MKAYFFLLLVSLLLQFSAYQSSGLRFLLFPSDSQQFLFVAYILLLVVFSTGIWAVITAELDILKLSPYLLTRLDQKKAKLIRITMKSSVRIGLITAMLFALLYSLRFFEAGSAKAVVISVFLTWLLWGSLISMLIWMQMGYQRILISAIFVFGASMFISTISPEWAILAFYTPWMDANLITMLIQKSLISGVLLWGKFRIQKKFEAIGGRL